MRAQINANDSILIIVTELGFVNRDQDENRNKASKKEKKGSNHAEIGVVAEAGLADDREVGSLPSIRLRVSQQPMRH